MIIVTLVMFSYNRLMTNVKTNVVGSYILNKRTTVASLHLKHQITFHDTGLSGLTRSNKTIKFGNRMFSLFGLCALNCRLLHL